MDDEGNHTDYGAASHGNQPLLSNQKSPDGENDQPDDKSVCSGFYLDCDSGGSERRAMGNSSDTAANFLPVSSQTIEQNACLPAAGESNPAIVEYSNLELHDGNCDNIDIPLEVSAVLVEIPSELVVSSPPPPYALVRGRRMRFLPQRMHLPSEMGMYRQHPNDFFRMHEQQRRQRELPKKCCESFILSGTLNVRWFIIIISFIALCCVVVGIVLGALKGANEFTGDDSLTIALLLIGVGIILLTVSGIAWRLTAKQGNESSLRHMLGFGSMRATSPALQSFRRASSGPFSAYVLRNSFGRSCPPGYYYEFQFRPPPPSYQAAMVDHRVRTLFDRNQNQLNNRTPPPGYRSRIDPHANPLPLLSQLHIDELVYRPPLVTLQPRSAPPSYRSRTGDGPGRERASLGQINAIFNENYSSGVYQDEGVTLARYPEERENRPAGRYYENTRSVPKGALGSNIELLAQL